MIEFFFYNNLKNEELIKKINQQYMIQDSYIYVKDYQNNNIMIDTNHNDNKQKITGKYVCFLNITFDEILKKINELNIGTKEKYHIHQTYCYLENNDEQKYVYLII